MELIHVWALASALGLAALATTLKAVEYRHELKLSNDMVSTLRKEFDSLEQKHNESIANSQQLNSAEKEKMLHRITELEGQLRLHRSKPIKYPNNGIV